MYQIDVSSAASTQPASTALGTVGFFTDGNPAIGVEATVVPAEFLNAIMLEMINAIKGAGLTLSKTSFNQLYNAIQVMSGGGASNYAADTGAANAYAVTYSPTVAAPSDGMVRAFKVKTTNTGASTFAIDGAAATFPIYGLAGAALQGGELVASGIAVIRFNSSLASNGAWVLYYCGMGAQQIAPAIAGNHAAQLGQVTVPVRNIAALRQVTKNSAGAVWVAGYNSPGDGGGGIYYLSAADTTTADDGGAVIVAADGGRWKLQSIGPVTVCQFGAIAGSGDNSAAIALADASPNIASYYYPPGIYRANNLTLTKPFDMHVDAVIQYSGSNQNDVVISFNGNNAVLGRVNVDGNGTNPLGLFNINGSGNSVAEVNVGNQTCPVTGIPNGAVKFLGNQNLIKRLSGTNLTGNNANVSCPQLLTFGGSSNQNTCEKLFGNNIRAGIVAYSTGAINYVGSADYIQINDNGCYMVMGYVSVTTLKYDGYDEPLVSIGGGGDFGTVIITSAGGANAVLGVNANGAVTIGEMLLHGPNSPAYIIRSRGTGATSVGAPIKIGRIAGGFYGTAPIYLNDTGNLDTLSIGSMDITHYFQSTSYTGSWIRVDAAKRLNLGKINIKVVDTTNALSSIYMVVNSALAYASVCDTIAVSIYNSDGVTASSGSFFGQNFFQQNMTYVGTANVHNSLAAIQKWDGTLPHGGGLFATAAPTAGYWKRGQQIQRLAPNAGATPGWVNVVAGSPGTFVQMANLQNS